MLYVCIQFVSRLGITCCETKGGVLNIANKQNNEYAKNVIADLSAYKDPNVLFPFDWIRLVALSHFTRIVVSELMKIRYRSGFLTATPQRD